MEYLFNTEYVNNSFSTFKVDRELPRHRWYIYKEGFSTKLVNEAINKLGINTNEYIIDPFNGSGTVTLSATKNNINSIGIEVNPFVHFVSTVKLLNSNSKELNKIKDKVLLGIDRRKYSPLSTFSTFSERTGKKKWLFNSCVLDSFEGGMNILEKEINKPEKELLKLALISAAMDNCNAIKDGKCVRYQPKWQEKKYNNQSFIQSFERRFNDILDDILECPLHKDKAVIHNDDARIILGKINKKKVRLIITSPPYLNSFDYTDIYRPELFLGRFINNKEELYNLRKKTLRSHVEIKLKQPYANDFGIIYSKIIIQLLERKDEFWDKQLAKMIQAYFEDIQVVLKTLFLQTNLETEFWIVVANSAYLNIEIPVDLIIAEIGSQIGWKLKEIKVLRFIEKRATKYSKDIKNLRESLLIFKK